MMRRLASPVARYATPVQSWSLERTRAVISRSDSENWGSFFDLGFVSGDFVGGDASRSPCVCWLGTARLGTE